MAASITITPASASIVAGGTFTAPTATGVNDTGSKATVTGPTWAPALDASKKGTYTATYKIAKGTGVAAAVSKTFVLTVTAKPVTPTPPASGSASFKDGSELRDGSKADAKYTAVVVAENADATVTTEAASAALFDEQGLDPYEVNNAK